jgi:GTP-binding protein
MNNDLIRNIAIVAHVDHGKTTLVDQLLKQSGTMAVKNEQRVMDSNDIERERGITILAKNTGIKYKGHTINIVDTPGHGDFSGEVERTLQMVEGFVLLVDAAEGVLPGTQFVLRKALALNLKPIVLINKIDRSDADIERTENLINNLFLDIAKNEDQLFFKVLYGSSRIGFVTDDPKNKTNDIFKLLDTIIDEIPSPKNLNEDSSQLLITNIDYSEFLGPIAIGRVFSGKFSIGDSVIFCKDDAVGKPMKLTKLYTFVGVDKIETQSVSFGDIVAVAGFSEQPQIGMTICENGKPKTYPYVAIDEPTMSMYFSVNDSPFSGKEGKLLTSRQIRDRLFKELRVNVALRVEEGSTTDSFKVSGRGQLHLGVLIENMRREGFELQISAPEVIYKEIKGVKCEPVEWLVVDVFSEHQGTVIQLLGNKKAELKSLEPYGSEGRVRMEFEVPSRGLLGFRSQFLTDTRGTGIATFSFHGYLPVKGDIVTRNKGALVSTDTGQVTAYALETIQQRGTLFVKPGDIVYKNQIIGENSREENLRVNPCKEKKLTNMRASGSDDSPKIEPPKIMTLETCLEWITPDEMIEATPISVRLRKNN